MRQIVISIILIVVGFEIIAQDTDFSEFPYVDYSRQKEYVIADIRITGVKYLQPQVLVNLSGLSVGDKITIPGDDITKAIEKYWKYGLFSDVKMLIDKIEDNMVYLQFYLLERPRLSRIRFHGIRKSENTDLNEKIELKAGSQITDNVINNVKTIITRHYVSKGYYNIDINIIPGEDTASFNKVFLDVYIDKDKKVKIGDIIFEGNEVYSDSKLRRLMKNTKKKNLNIFKASKYIEADYKEDKGKLLSFYNENGFRDAQILETELKSIDNNRLVLVISLEEGKKYHVRNLTWLGNTQYPTEILDHLLGFKKGDVYDQNLLEKRLHTDQDAITSLYMDNGYLFFSIDPVEEVSVDLEMRVY